MGEIPIYFPCHCLSFKNKKGLLTSVIRFWMALRTSLVCISTALVFSYVVRIGVDLILM